MLSLSSNRRYPNRFHCIVIQNQVLLFRLQNQAFGRGICRHSLNVPNPSLVNKEGLRRKSASKSDTSEAR